MAPLVGERRVFSNVVRAYDAREQRRRREIARWGGFWDAADECHRFTDRNRGNRPPHDVRRTGNGSLKIPLLVKSLMNWRKVSTVVGRIGRTSANTSDLPPTCA